ncbi:hypothetical protein [Phytohabitans houttuyneae]|uniref:hypothetical protein n=1 Tax=Phytohabitans houttuyneae TaxID=1076126 RepID=UPI0015640464|nr:hypothetical protein [Phytohabitans houttuyneae]
MLVEFGDLVGRPFGGPDRSGEFVLGAPPRGPRLVELLLGEVPFGAGGVGLAAFRSDRFPVVDPVVAVRFEEEADDEGEDTEAAGCW